MGNIHLDVADHIATIVIDNPEKRNAIDGKMSLELDRAYDEITTNDDIRVAIITGQGPLAFCAGGYIPAYVENGVVGSTGDKPRTPLPKPWRIWKPFIGAIRGAAVGGGFGLALSCDLRVAAHDATIGPSGLRRGVVQGGQQTQRLTRIIPFARALEILLLSKYLTGAEAYEVGLVNKAVEGDDVLPTAREWARTIAEFSPYAVQNTKRLAYEGYDMDWDKAFAWEEEITADSFRRPDAQEGFTSFFEKRPADFEGARNAANEAMKK